MSAAQSEARYKMLCEPGTLYAAYSRYCDWVKIGFTSKDVKDRVDCVNVQYAHFAPFSLIGSTRSTWRAEQQIHSAFAPFRHRNVGLTKELYPATPSLVSAIKSILSAPEWTPYEWPLSAKFREWSRNAANLRPNREPALAAFDRYKRERAIPPFLRRVPA